MNWFNSCSRPGVTKRVALLVLMVSLFVANSGYFCPGRVTCDGGVTTFKFFVPLPGIQADFFTVFAGEENGRLEFGGFGEPGTKVGVYRYEDLSGGLAAPCPILAINPWEAHVDSIQNDTFEVDFEIHFRWEPDGWWSINNPRGADPLLAGEHNFTFFKALIIPTQPAIDLQRFAFGKEFKQSNVLLDLGQTWRLPHAPNGQLLLGSVNQPKPAGEADLLSVVTQVVVNNAQDRAQNFNLSFRSALTGDPAPVKIGDVTSDQFDFVISANTSQVYSLDPRGFPLQVNWGTLTSEGHLGVATNFVSILESGGAGSPAGTLPAGTVDAQAGIAASDLDVYHVLSVEKRAGGFDTALAILNPTVATATIAITLVEEESAAASARQRPAGDPFASSQLVLAPGTQTARFFTELLDIEVEEFSGTIILDSDTDIAVTSLRTINGKQASSLPGGTPLPR